MLKEIYKKTLNLQLIMLLMKDRKNIKNVTVMNLNAHKFWD